MNKLLTRLQNIMDEINNNNKNGISNNNLYLKAEKLVSKIEKKIEDIEKKSINEDTDDIKINKHQIIEKLIYNNKLLDDENTGIDSSINIYLESKKLEKQYFVLNANANANAIHII